VYPFKHASDHEDHRPEQMISCVCGEVLKRHAIAEHLSKDATGQRHLSLLVSRLHPVDKGLARKKRKRGERDTDCSRKILKMEYDGPITWSFDLRMFQKHGIDTLYSEPFLHQFFIFQLVLVFEDQTDDEWVVGVRLECTGQILESRRTLVGVKASFDLGAADLSRRFERDEYNILHHGYGFGGILVEQTLETLQCWANIDDLRAEYGLTEEEAELCAAGEEEAKDQGTGGCLRSPKRQRT
jgi:hypothetical protein